MDDIQGKNKNLFQTIIDNCFGNIFVTDGDGKVIYLNESSASSLGCTREVLLSMTSQEMLDAGIIERSAPLTVIKSRKTTMMSVPCNLTKLNLAVVCTPVFDKMGKLVMTISYSQTEARLNEFLKTLEEERQNFKQMLSYLDSNINIVAESTSAKEVFEYAKKVAASDSTVILYGESGTGKDVLSRYIHRNSRREAGIYIPINCAAVPHELMESEFFGYDKGAFTGANKEGKVGILELANKGTLFLDEIGELPLFLQPKLLRVLETGEFSRVGSTRVRQTDLRVIAATNRDLRAMVKEGKFREDLYYRLNVIPITMLPLRERLEDIIALAHTFLDSYNKKYGYSKFFPRETLETFTQYSWPGNVRELKNVVERLVITSASDCLKLNSSQLDMSIFRDSMGVTNKTITIDYSISLKKRVEQYEGQYIREVLKDCGGNVDLAAERLGMHRSGLYKKIAKLNISK